MEFFWHHFSFLFRFLQATQHVSCVQIAEPLYSSKVSHLLLSQTFQTWIRPFEVHSGQMVEVIVVPFTDTTGRLQVFQTIIGNP